MKEVVKVSIAGVSFTLDTDAHYLLDQYLGELKAHYKTEENGQEIIDDIEERIAELILEKGVKERVVSCEEIRNIIDILGRPYDIDGGSAVHGSIPVGSANSGVQKKLFRDINNKVLGGVCSGLGAYMNIDAVFVRIIFIALALLVSWSGVAWCRVFFGFGCGSGFGFMVLVYIILWAIIPPARTVAQRCAMNGESPGIDDIQRKVKEGGKNTGNEGRTSAQQNNGSFLKGLGSVLLAIIGVMLLISGFAGIITGSFLLLGLEVFKGVSAFALVDYVQLNIGNIVWLKILGLLVYFLPFVGMLYAGLQLCFKFKTPKWRPGLVIFLVWIVSFLLFGLFTAKALKPYFNNSTEYASTEMPENYDTVYLKLQHVSAGVKSRGYLEKGNHYYNLFYVNELPGEKSHNLEFVAYPDIRLVRYEEGKKGKKGKDKEKPFKSYVECRYNRFSGLALVDLTEESFNPGKVFTIQDSLITVYPNVYTIDHKYNGEINRLYIYIPKNTVVKIVDEDRNLVNKHDWRRRQGYIGEFGSLDD